MKKRELVSLLQESGFELKRKGKHLCFVNEHGARITIPYSGSKELNPGLVRQIKIQIRRGKISGQTIETVDETGYLLRAGVNKLPPT